jgi:predicted ribosomally synthesized peptide with SipW-like signal peptide
MSIKRNVKRTLLLSVILTFACITMFIGSTFAWFTDSVSSGSNVIVTGNLDVEVKYTLDGDNWSDLDGANDLFQKGLWEPGHTEVVALKITNNGSLALQYQAKMNIVNEVIGKNKDGGDIVLSDILMVSTLTQGVDQAGDTAIELAFTSEDALTYSSTTSFNTLNVLQSSDTVLLPGDAQYVIVKVDMDNTVGNEANHDGKNVPSIEFGINVIATQAPYESDSFDNLYDVLTDKTVLITQSKTLVDGDDTVRFDLYTKGIVLAKVRVPASAIADPTQPVTVTFDGIDPTSTIDVEENERVYAYDINVSNLKPKLTGDQLVTVIMTAPNALATMKAYHNGKLIEDAVYDEVAGTITFKTANFSPYAFEYTEVSVTTLEGLRDAVTSSDVEIRLDDDLVIDLTKDSSDRNEDHVLKSGLSTYYNAVNIIGQNVAINLNGHSITVFCDDDRKGNSDVGALFYVTENGSLNIIDREEGGFIKMRSSIYAVWAPFASPSYVDIYSGIFIADAYAGDPIGTPYGANGEVDMANGNMANENSNRSLIYAGAGGNMNVYGGFFLYNNTTNDTLNRNNGAFNAKDHFDVEKPFITIHEGVYLINKEYRQNPANTSTPNGTFDDKTILLNGQLEVKEVTLDTPLTVDGKTYGNWFKISPNYLYKITFKNYDGTQILDEVEMYDTNAVTIDDIDDVAITSVATDFGGWVNVAGEVVTSIASGNTKDIVLLASYETKFVARWVDENGNVIDSEIFTKSTKALKTVEGPVSIYENLAFDHWEIRNVDSTGKITFTELKDFSFKNADSDITLYPYYVVSIEGLGLKGVDTDGDGRFDHYIVEGVAGDQVKTDVTIPGYVNGCPVKTVVDLTEGWAGVQHIIIEDGVEEISANAFAETKSLTTVEIPLSVTYIGSKAFAVNRGQEGKDKDLTIYYAGTFEQWKKIVANDWAKGLSTTTKLVCADGTYMRKSNNGQWQKQ